MLRLLFNFIVSASLVLLSLPLTAGIDEATKAYIQGDFNKARYEALIGATDGDPAAQMLMGQLYFKGEGVEKNIELAMYWYEQAAKQGFDEAQYRLGTLYLDDKNGIQKNYNKAWEWLKKADDAGHDKTEPLMEVLYKQENGEVVNLNESPVVLQQASDKGVLKAQYLLATKLIEGKGVAENKIQAVELMTDTARKGFIKAQKMLGEWYMRGLGVEIDYVEAYGWSMAYAGTKELGGIIREGKQTARSSLRNLPEDEHRIAYEKSREYFEQYVIPFHKNAREVGPDKYRIVVRSSVPSRKQAPDAPASTTATATPESKNSAPAKQPVVTKAGVTGSADLQDPKKANSENDITADQKQQVTGTTAAVSKDQVTSNTGATQAENTQSSSGSPTSENLADKGGDNPLKTAASADITRSSSTPNSGLPLPGKTESSEKTVNEPESVVLNQASSTAQDASAGSAKPVSRDQQTVKNQFETHLVRINDIFIRARQLDSALQGRLNILLEIEPDGKVSKVELSAASFQSPEFEQELADYLKTLDFGAKNAPQYLFSYQLDLVPQ